MADKWKFVKRINYKSDNGHPWEFSVSFINQENHKQEIDFTTSGLTSDGARNAMHKRIVEFSVAVLEAARDLEKLPE